MLLLHVCVFLLLVNLSYSHTKDITNQKQHHDSLVFELMKSVHKMMVQHAEDVKDLNKKLHNQREEHDEEMNTLKTKHDEDIKQLKSGADMKSLESKMNKLQKQHGDDMKILKINMMKCDASMKTLQTVIKKHDDDIKELQTKHAEDIKNQEKVIQCPSKLLVKWRGHCYGLFSMALSYQKSQTHCQSLGANLVWIEDSAEQKFLERTFSHKQTKMWIGCNDIDNEGKFVWIHNNQPVTYSNWDKDEPNDAYGGEDCCEMSHYAPVNGRWNDMPCREGIRHFICKI